MLDALIGGAIGLGTLGLNAKHSGDSLAMQKDQFNRSHALAQDQLYNGVQIRRKDLEAAGLHPTLAAGNAGHTPLPAGGAQHRPPLDAGAILHNALIGAQVGQVKAQTALTNAEAEKIKSETLHIPKRYELDVYRLHNVDAPMTALAENRDNREGEMHGITKRFREFEYKLLQLNVRGEQQRQTMVALDKVIKEMDRDYMKKHGMKMPTDDAILRSMQKHLTQIGLTTYLAGRVANEALKPVTEILNYRLRARPKPQSPKRTSSDK